MRYIFPTACAACALLLGWSATSGKAAEPGRALVVERLLPLPGLSGRIDHLAVDLAHQRLFVAGVGAGVLQSLDLRTGKTLGRVERLKEPQGVAYLDALDEVVVASGGDGTIRFYRAGDLQPVGMAQLTGDADNVRVEQKTGLVVVADGRGLVLVDPIRRTVVGSIPLGAHPEGFQINQAGQRAILNIPGQRRIVLVDLAARKLVASWPQRGAIWNFPMALSPSGLAAAVFRAPAVLVLFDAESGAISGRLKTCGDSDDVHFDPRRGRIYVSCGSGVVESFEGRNGAYASLGITRTRSGARTSLFVPTLDRMLVAEPAGAFGAEAAIAVLRPAN